MRGILDAGGNITEDWTVERVAQVGDQATGTTVMADLYPADEGDRRCKWIWTISGGGLGVAGEERSGDVRRPRAASRDPEGDYARNKRASGAVPVR